MTRALSAKAGAALLRNAFTSKGASLSHTEALDLMAKLAGYQAWSHMQQATRNGDAPASESAPESASARPAAKPRGPQTARQVLVEHYGPNGSCPAFPLEAWNAAESREDYWDWVVMQLRGSENWSKGPFQWTAPASVAVTLPSGEASQWAIEQNLSTRCGEFNDTFRELKPGLMLLEHDTPLWERLAGQMWDETTFVVRKDKAFGLLFEVEFLSKESEGRTEGEDLSQYKPREEVIATLASKLQGLAAEYPQVEFCVPDPNEIWYERPAVWGFFKLDALTEEQREDLGTKLINL
jgi:hypothetical protein